MTSLQARETMDSTGASKFDSERQLYVRVIKFMAAMMVFFALMFLSQKLDQSGSLFYLLGIVGGVGLLYMIGSLIYAVFVINPQNDIRNILTDAELAGMQDESDDEEDTMVTASQLADSPMQDTPKLIRSCREQPSPFLRPKNGRYSIVYNAVYFGKSIRSESQLYLKFEETNYGWEIQGSILSGGKQQDSSSRRAIAEGFLNPKGEMYWKLANPENEANLEGIYRGAFDLRSLAMYDGEFKAGSAPPGRIVRMEFVAEEEEEQVEEHSRSQPTSREKDDWGSPNFDEDWGAQDVEMVTLDKSIV